MKREEKLWCHVPVPHRGLGDKIMTCKSSLPGASGLAPLPARADSPQAVDGELLLLLARWGRSSHRTEKALDLFWGSFHMPLSRLLSLGPAGAWSP